MTELRINGYARVNDLLRKLLPYLRFKKIQAEAIVKASELLCRKKFLRNLDQKEKENLVSLILSVQNENYKSRHKKTESELRSALDLVPVTTSSDKNRRDSFKLESASIDVDVQVYLGKTPTP